MTTKGKAYQEAGVDIDVMMSALARARRDIRKTRTAGMLGETGSFGGLFKAPGRDHVLVSSIDGVGTKLKVAHLAGKHDTIGRDLVNHCVNDILAQGAEPLFFMDYLGTAKLDADDFVAVISGLSKACRENGCALIGGETAEMPGLYPRGEYDLVGAIVGAAPRKDLITGRSIRSGDVLIGLPSSGLHTNGYSLARKVLFEKARLRIHDRLPGTKRTMAQVLLAVHKSYLKPIRALRKKVKVHGLAHITGGGLVDNVPRILPDNRCAVIDRSAWKIPAVFRFLEEKGRIDHDEMYRVFNMGIGMVVVVRSRDAAETMAVLRKAGERPQRIGHIKNGSQPIEFTGTFPDIMPHGGR